MKRPNTVVVVFLLAIAAFLGSLTNAVEGQGSITDAPSGFELVSNGSARRVLCEPGGVDEFDHLAAHS